MLEQEKLKREFKNIHLIFMQASDGASKGKALDLIAEFTRKNVPGVAKTQDEIATRLKNL